MQQARALVLTGSALIGVALGGAAGVVARDATTSPKPVLLPHRNDTIVVTAEPTPVPTSPPPATATPTLTPAPTLRNYPRRAIATPTPTWVWYYRK